MPRNAAEEAALASKQVSEGRCLMRRGKTSFSAIKLVDRVEKDDDKKA